MDIWDYIDDDREDDPQHLQIDDQLTIDKIKMLMEQLEHEQPLISQKSVTNGFSVEREHINSKAFHDKFEREILPINKNVSESLYKETGRLLDFVDGQDQERMIAIDARTGKFIVDNFNREGTSKSTSFNDNELKLIFDNPNNVILIHNHSYNRPPSGRDIQAFAEQDKVKLSIIAAHDGYIYAIISASKECIKED